MATFDEFLQNFWRITVGFMEEDYAVKSLKIEIEDASLSHT